MKGHDAMSGSLDMLLDTMCNTFGGVCFIALLVSVISVSLPPDRRDDGEAAAAQGDQRVSMLVRQRNRLAQSIEMLKAQLSAMTNAPAETTVEAMEARAVAARNRAAEAERESEKRRRESAEVRAQADEVKSREDELNALIASLEREIGDPKYRRTRMVRVPYERELSGYKTYNILLFRGGLFDLQDEESVSVKRGVDKIVFTTRPHGGLAVSEGFTGGGDWRRILDKTISSTIIRIYTDRESAGALKILVQDLASRRRPYNWRYNDEGSAITFVEGSDTFVQ